MMRIMTALLLLLAMAAAGGCGGPVIPPGDEVTTRMNERDERALDDAASGRRGVDAGASSASSPGGR